MIIDYKLNQIRDENIRGYLVDSYEHIGQRNNYIASLFNNVFDNLEDAYEYSQNILKNNDFDAELKSIDIIGISSRFRVNYKYFIRLYFKDWDDTVKYNNLTNFDW